MNFFRRRANDPQDLLRGIGRFVPDGYDADRRQQIADFKATFLSTLHGRRTLWLLLKWGRVFSTTFVPGDPYWTHKNEGGRDLALRVLLMANAAALPEDLQSETTNEER